MRDGSITGVVNRFWRFIRRTSTRQQPIRNKPKATFRPSFEQLEEKLVPSTTTLSAVTAPSPGSTTAISVNVPNPGTAGNTTQSTTAIPAQQQQLAQIYTTLSTNLENSANIAEASANNLIALANSIRNNAAEMRQAGTATGLSQLQTVIQNQQAEAAVLRGLSTTIGQAAQYLEKTSAPLNGANNLLSIVQILKAENGTQFGTAVNNALRGAFVSNATIEGGTLGARLGVGAGALIPGVDLTGASEVVLGGLGAVTGGVTANIAATNFWNTYIGPTVTQAATAAYNSSTPTPAPAKNSTVGSTLPSNTVSALNGPGYNSAMEQALASYLNSNAASELTDDSQASDATITETTVVSDASVTAISYDPSDISD